ncbi:MAG TPA: M6 family metalloprotease domain-containing protein, partial [Longimicrobium sp.]
MTAAPRRNGSPPAARMRALKRGALGALVLAALFIPAAGAAQDVVEQGRARGVRAPEPVLRVLEQDPEAFEFKRAWRQKTARARAQRVALERRGGPRLSIAQIQGASAAVTGTLRVPVLLGLPYDRPAPYTTAEYQARLFGDVAGTYSALTLYREMSRGAFRLDGTVSPWLLVPQPAAYYDPSPYTDATFGRTKEYLRDVLVAADPGIDFGRFDNDGPDGVPNSGDDDGYVDAAAFVYPSHGKACGGPGIWPHRWTYTAQWGTPFTTNDRSASGPMIRVDDYLIQGGVECDGRSLMQIGTFSHEMGHALGLPDLYDTYSSDGTTQGVGEWDLMGSGNYRLPDAPVHMGAWSKDFLGWVAVETIAGPAAGHSLAPVYQAGRVLRYDIPNTAEYFLLEHRAATGSDRNIHGPGLLVYHVDQAVLDNTLYSNRVNAHRRQGVKLEEADGLSHLDRLSSAGGNRGDAGDPFPGIAGATGFGPGTFPSSHTNSGAPSGFSLRNISPGSGTITFDFEPVALVVPVATVEVSPAAVALERGGTRQLSATVRDASGNVLTGRAVTWSSAGPGVATVSAGGLVTGVAAGGPVAVTASSGGKSGSAQVTVAEPKRALALGDSARGELTATSQRDTVQISLTAGDVIDLGAFSTGGDAIFHPRPALLNDFGVHVAAASVRRDRPRGWIVARYRVPATGIYHIIVSSYNSGSYGTYVLRTRRGGPLLAYTSTVFSPQRPHGSSTVAPDTMWVYNAGSGSVSFSVLTGGSSWLTVTPSGGTATGTAGGAQAPGQARVDGPAVHPARSGAPVVGADGPASVVQADLGPAAEAEAAPAGSIAIVISSNPAGLPQGHHRDSVTVRSLRDAWNEDLKEFPSLRLYDPRAQVLDTTVLAFPGTMALGPQGDLVIAANRDLRYVNWETGATAPWVSGLSSRIDGMELSPGGSLLVADRAGNRVVSVDRGGGTQTLIPGTAPAYDVAVLPDGTFFAAIGGSLVRQGLNGVAPVTVLSTSRAIFTYAIVYNPLDGWLYYTTGGTLRRYHPTTLVDEQRGLLPSTGGADLISLVVGRSGHLYGAENLTFGSVLELDTRGMLLARHWQPSVGFGLVLDEGKLFGSGFLPRYMVWSVPV